MPSEKFHQETRALIEAIEKKDRRFRMAQAVFMAVSLVTLFIIVGAQFNVLTTVRDQQKQLTDYLRCISLTPPENRNAELVEKCLTKPLPPQTNRNHN